MNPNWRVVIYHLVETLMRMISRCEILVNCKCKLNTNLIKKHYQ